MNQLQVSKTKTILLGGNTYFIAYCHNTYSAIYFSM